MVSRARRVPFFSLRTRASLREGHVWASGGTPQHTTRYDTATRHEAQGIADLGRNGRKDTCCTARWVAVSGLCDSFSSVRICLSPSSCGCHAIFIVFFNSTTVTRSLPSLTSQINGSSLQRSLSFFLSPPSLPSASQPMLPPLPRAAVRTVVARGGATPFLRDRSGRPPGSTRFSRPVFNSLEKTRWKPVRETRIPTHQRVSRDWVPAWERRFRDKIPEQRREAGYFETGLPAGPDFRCRTDQRAKIRLALIPRHWKCRSM